MGRIGLYFFKMCLHPLDVNINTIYFLLLFRSLRNFSCYNFQGVSVQKEGFVITQGSISVKSVIGMIML